MWYGVPLVQGRSLYERRRETTIASRPQDPFPAYQRLFMVIANISSEWPCHIPNLRVVFSGTVK